MDLINVRKSNNMTCPKTVRILKEDAQFIDKYNISLSKLVRAAISELRGKVSK